MADSLLVGLGNPGERYRHTRHNLGWDALWEILRTVGIGGETKRFQGFFMEGRLESHRLLALFPLTYMNLSGESVAAAVHYYKLSPGQVIVFHDDLDLALGRVRMKVGGGNAGHNGLKSIQQQLGSADFVRVRLGIGRPPASMDAARFVLAPFVSSERDIVVPILEELPRILPLILQGELVKAMNHLSNPASIS
ncbi:MAG: aminoacyl-tRNA hydrolase [Magnetococcus sp. DMHC-6]